MLLYSMLDKKMGEHGPIMMGLNDGHMSRTLVESFRGSNHTVARFPEDYDLYQVGEFDVETGSLRSDVRFVCNVSVVLNPIKE